MFFNSINKIGFFFHNVNQHIHLHSANIIPAFSQVSFFTSFKLAASVLNLVPLNFASTGYFLHSWHLSWLPTDFFFCFLQLRVIPPLYPRWREMQDFILYMLQFHTPTSVFRHLDSFQSWLLWKSLLKV